jgi:hypothetical protein
MPDTIRQRIGKMSRNWWFAGLVGFFLCAAGVETSQANTLYVSFSCAACGDISATNLAFNVSGTSGDYLASGITGNVTVGTSNIDSDNVSSGTYAASLLSVDAIFSNDNMFLYPNTPYLTADGFGFSLAGLPGYKFQVDSGGGSLYDLFIFAATEMNYGMDTFSVSDVSSTPLPATWCMLLGGLVGLGFIGFRGSKKKALAAA